MNAGRRLWFDELLTFDIAKTPDLTRLFYLVKTWDLSPPTAHLLAHYSMRLFGENALGVRLPSMVEFYIAGLMLLWYTSRKAGYAYGVAALLFLWCSPAFYYASEARPYALLCMWFCCLLVSWDIATSAPRRTLALWGIAISSLGLIESHVFAPLSLLPFVAAEAVRWMKIVNRITRFCWPYCCRRSESSDTCLCISAISTLPSTRSPFKPRSRKWLRFIGTAARDIVWYICIAVAAAVLANKIQVGWRKPEKFRSADAVLFAVLLANPIFLNLILMRDHAAFWPRYCITSAFGLMFCSRCYWHLPSTPDPNPVMLLPSPLCA